MPCAFEIVSSTCSTELLCPFCRTEVEDLRASAADDDEECEEEKRRESVDPEAPPASETTPPEMAMSALDRTDYSRWTLIA